MTLEIKIAEVIRKIPLAVMLDGVVENSGIMHCDGAVQF